MESKKWFWRIYLQGRNGETDIENRLENRETDIENREHGERGEEGEKYGKSNMETYVAICEIDSQWDYALWLRKPKRGSVST